LVLHIIIFGLLTTLCEVQLVGYIQGKAAKLLTMTFHHNFSLYLFYALAFTTDRQKHFAPWSEIPLPQPTIIRSHIKSIAFMSHGFFFHGLTTEGRYRVEL
jgi:hypothetical protein